MVLPLNLAMTPSEIATTDSLPERISWMSCYFCPYTEGITNIPEALPEGAMLILTDRENCSGHSRDLVAQQLLDTVQKLHCESVLLDFQRPPNPELEAMVTAIVQALPCPVAVTESYAASLDCPVFLPPCPLHIPMEDYLKPWHSREIWLEAALCQETITVTDAGTAFTPVYSTDSPAGEFYHQKLRCRYHPALYYDRILFTLFDTPETLEEKLEAARILGVHRAVGLYQELSPLG